METPKTKPEVTPTPHTPEIKPGEPQQLPPTPHMPEIAPGKQDPPPSKGPKEVPQQV